MIAEIISVGDELLLGKTTDTNATYISLAIADLGIELYHRTTVGDKIDDIIEAVIKASNRADLIFITGGLGPTEDDLTKEAVAQALKVELVIDETMLEKINKRVLSFGGVVDEGQRSQAFTPSPNGFLIANEMGTAPAIVFEKDNISVMCTPGVPREMKWLMENGILNYVKTKLSDQSENLKSYSSWIHTIGIGESMLEKKMLDIIGEDPVCANTYVGEGECHARIKALTPGLVEGEALVNSIIERLKAALPDIVYAQGSVTLEDVIFDLLIKNSVKIACAESCTGGMIASSLTSLAGSSAFFDRGFVTYSNKSKIDVLGVSEVTLSYYGAVSEETATEMANGALKRSDADISISVTGIAGPDGATMDKPVGLVYICIADKNETVIKKCSFMGDRNMIRIRTVKTALNMLRLKLLDYENK